MKAPIDILIKLMNFWVLLFVPKKRANLRYANIFRDAFDLAQQIETGQLFKVYGRITSRYNYHPLQRFENLLRCFDVVTHLATQMEQAGNFYFYQNVCQTHNAGADFNYKADLTKIDDINGLSSSGRCLHDQLYPWKGAKAAEEARKCYMRGFSRKVKAQDYNDWEALRNELRSGIHVGNKDWQNIGEENNVLLFAISYKAKEVKISRKMQILNDDGTPAEDTGVLYQEEQQLTMDFLDDFRWSQVVRSCMTYAQGRGIGAVRIWIDRLVMMGYSSDERKEIYDAVRWEDFGLFAYMVCPVVRVYDREEINFGTDFWRKLEAVMGVAGRGLVVDDYMLRKFDSIYYGESMYTRLPNGLSVIGGGGVHIRAVTLAVATAVLTDGVSVAAANEDKRTKRDIEGWKAWALRTIAKGAYSSQHALIMMPENPFKISLRDFKVIVFWESMVSTSPYLTGKSYMDMSFKRSMEWRKNGYWDGVIEWVGMMHGGCDISERAQIMAFLTARMRVELYAATTGHVASILTLNSLDGVHKRTLVVDLARYSTAVIGHVTAVAEATGLWGKNLLPWYLRFRKDPDNNQTAEITFEGKVCFAYERMTIEFMWHELLRGLLVASIIVGVPIPVLAYAPVTIPLFIVVWVLIALCLYLQFWLSFKWPWRDFTDVGEALFDNLLMHGLYKAGIKTQYRKLKSVEYDQLGWT